MGMNQLGLFDLTNSPNKSATLAGSSGGNSSGGVSSAEAGRDLEVARLREELSQAR